MKKKQLELRCCLYCGRDTRSENQICYRCTSGFVGFEHNKGQINDSKDRSILPLPLPFVEDDLEYTEFYKENTPDHDCRNGEESTTRFLNRMNKTKAKQ